MGFIIPAAPSIWTAYGNEFEGRRNFRPLDTAEQRAALAEGAGGKHRPYADLIAETNDCP